MEEGFEDGAALPDLVQYDDFEGTTHGTVQLEDADLSYVMPGEVKDFILHFHGSIKSMNLLEIQACYEAHFKKMSDKYYKESSWPEPVYINRLVKADELFITLYSELYYRHIYTKVEGGPKLEHRFDSYENYIDLFNHIIKSDVPVPLELPNTWLWDIIDEFIYQFQDFTMYRSKVCAKSDEEVGVASEKASLADNSQMWSVLVVLNVLHTLVLKSNINAQLEVYQQGGNPQDVAGEFGSRTLYKMLGYFSLVGLLRLQSLLGDYRQALQVMANSERNKLQFTSKVPNCQVTMSHYIGFCYLMLRRYQDAVAIFQDILSFIQRLQHIQTRTYGFEAISRKRDHILALLALTYTLLPQRLEDSVHKEMMDREGEAIEKIQAGDAEARQALFAKGCPRFLSPVVPDLERPAAAERTPELFALQVKIFKSETTQQAMVPTIRSYLKLYKSMKMKKLASFLNVSEEELRLQLHCYKHKMYQLNWSAGQPLSGERQCADSLDFYIDGDMIHIANVTVARCYGADFVKESLRMLKVDKQ